MENLNLNSKPLTHTLLSPVEGVIEAIGASVGPGSEVWKLTGHPYRPPYRGGARLKSGSTLLGYKSVEGLVVPIENMRWYVMDILDAPVPWPTHAGSDGVSGP